MRLNKRLTHKKYDNAEKAIESHAGFIRFVGSEVKKRGIKKVLSATPSSDIYWLKEAWKEMREFAADVQLKQIAQKIEGGGENGEFEVTVRISSGDSSTQEPRNRIGEYFAV